ncbi:hypothetical protein ACHAXA_005377 [Cyclostephanos tholiformis]|uniref:Cytochrome b561 domain-containing protein n=1 Tax=Cyclostephanos tholiformis TaxID=382380 RepID=A0ABD3RGP8_9STRA
MTPSKIFLLRNYSQVAFRFPSGLPQYLLLDLGNTKSVSSIEGDESTATTTTTMMTTTIAFSLAIIVSLSSSSAVVVSLEERHGGVDEGSLLPHHSRRSLEDSGALLCPDDVLECPGGGIYLERNPENGCEFGDCPDDYGIVRSNNTDDVLLIDDGDMHRNESVVDVYNDIEYNDHDDSVRSAWIAHGIIGALVFGLLVPTSISSALFRDYMPSHWIYVHVGINSLVFVMTVAGVSVAVTTMHGMGVPWEGHMKEVHHVVGLTLLMMVSFQTANGFLRPPREYESDDLANAAIDNDDAHLPSYPIGASSTIRSRTNGFVAGLTLRKMWHIMHASTGLFVFGLGSYQVQGGLGLYALRYGVPDYGSAYVGYVCWLIGVIACVKLWMACRRRKSMPNFSE